MDIVHFIKSRLLNSRKFIAVSDKKLTDTQGSSMVIMNYNSNSRIDTALEICRSKSRLS